MSKEVFTPWMQHIPSEGNRRSFPQYGERWKRNSTDPDRQTNAINAVFCTVYQVDNMWETLLSSNILNPNDRDTLQEAWNKHLNEVKFQSKEAAMKAVDDFLECKGYVIPERKKLDETREIVKNEV